MNDPLWSAGREIACNHEMTTELTAWAADVCAANGVDYLPAARLQLVLEELFTNMLDHGSGAQANALQVTLSATDDVLQIVWKDSGRAFNPLDHANMPDFEADIEDRAVGGLGLHLVKNLVQEIHYAYRARQNVLEMTLAL